jgi:hypothetical protein
MLTAPYAKRGRSVFGFWLGFRIATARRLPKPLEEPDPDLRPSNFSALRVRVVPTAAWIAENSHVEAAGRPFDGAVEVWHKNPVEGCSGFVLAQPFLAHHPSPRGGRRD